MPEKTDEKRFDSDNRSEDYQAYENLVKETTGPIMEITASLSFTCKTVSKIKIGSTEDFIRFQTIFRSIRINTRNNTQFVLII